MSDRPDDFDKVAVPERIETLIAGADARYVKNQVSREVTPQQIGHEAIQVAREFALG
jgi:hypothetical protein